MDGKPQQRGYGDRLSKAQVAKLQNETFYGFDVDIKMVHLATMNLTLRGLANVHILRRNVLTSALDLEKRAAFGLPEAFDVVFANPPFSGRLDKDRVIDEVKVGSTTATEILFLKFMIESLKPGGCCSAPPGRTRSCAGNCWRITSLRRRS